MTSHQLSVVPRSGEAESPDLLRDCEVATQLLRKIAEEHPRLTAQEAFQVLRDRVSRVCIFPWDKMQLAESPKSD
ncbi:MAG: hypothetical protein KDA81_15350 [Planctomycetaceae bacterium]|nr:hypothetical protein [Planctomycetaceae bacterium]